MSTRLGGNIYHLVQYSLALCKFEKKLDTRKHLLESAVRLVILFADPTPHVIWPHDEAARKIVWLESIFIIRSLVKNLNAVGMKPVAEISVLNIVNKLPCVGIISKVGAFWPEE
jgi:hypothetical protein